jgi:hypothetical protein
LRKFGGGRARGIDFAVDDCHGRAIGGKSRGDRPANAVGAAGYQCYLSLEIDLHEDLFFCAKDDQISNARHIG